MASDRIGFWKLQLGARPGVSTGACCTKISPQTSGALG